MLGFAVSTEYRRQGIGRALMLQAESWAKKQGIRKIRLNSGGARKEAHEFYRAQGFDSEKAQICFMKDFY
ncbi:MAG: GNAT family N-acetyltransferase [Lachnospiraceae bacterium]|nr:GNAT family N-acetyltransferase [Lachnospiraceae bacterium]